MPVRPRSLADDLRHRSDDQIQSLLASRDDLLRPVPTSLSDLARKANTSASVSSVLDQLSATDLTVLEASCALVPDHRLTAQLLQTGLDAETNQIAKSVERLWQLALLWGPQDDLRVPSAVRESMGSQPCGIDQVVRGRDPNAATITIASVEDGSGFTGAPPGTPRLLHELTWQNPIVSVHDDDLSDAVTWLRGQKMLIPVGEYSLALPRETSLRIRHGRLLSGPTPTAPELDGRSWPLSQSNSTSAHAADIFIRLADRIADSLQMRPLSVRNRGGLAAREWRVRADELQLSDADFALAIEVTWQAGWLHNNGSQSLVPTIHFSQKAQDPRQSRWAELAQAWLMMARRPWHDSPDSEDLPASTPLSPDLASEQIPVTKADLLHALSRSRSSIAATNMRSWLEWRRPRSKPTAQVVGELMAQAEILGITGLGTISPPGIALSNGEPQSAIAAALEPLLVPTDDRVFLQADLTATGTAPLTARTERRLARVAEFVSGGGATVYRFTHESLARGLARGERPEALLEWLREISATDIPRALSVLVDDVAREQCDVRVVPASAAVSGDPNTLNDLLSSPALASAGLTRLSASALTTTVAPNKLLGMLESAGIQVHELPTTEAPTSHLEHEPVADAVGALDSSTRARVVRALREIETETGDPGDYGASRIRADDHAPAPQNPGDHSVAPATQIASDPGASTSLASDHAPAPQIPGDQSTFPVPAPASASAPVPAPGPAPASASAPVPAPDSASASAPVPIGAARLPKVLSDASELESEVWLEFSDASGSMQIHLVRPIDVASGMVTVFNRTQNSIQEIPLSRILGVLPT